MDFAAKLEQALEEAHQHRERAVSLSARAKELELEFKTLRKNRVAPPEKITAAGKRWKAALRETRGAEARAVAIESAAYDLKAVNPHRRTEEETRPPAEILTAIAERGREADAALERLRVLVAG